MAATIWKGQLTFGLVSIPVKLFRAARPEKIHMHRIDRRTGSRVRQVFVPADAMPAPVAPPAAREPAPSGLSLVLPKSQPQLAKAAPPPSVSLPVPPPAQPEKLAATDMVRAYEFEKDKYVAFEPEELDKIEAKTSPDMQIVEFVRFAEVDPIYLENSFYVAADKGGDKPYALLFEALKTTGYAAIAELVMHRRDQTMILRAGPEGIIAHTLFYEDEVKRENAFRADPSLVAPKEMDLAVKLVNALAEKFEPAKLKDKFRERLQAAITAKIETGTVSEPEVVTPEAPVVDILAALKESLSKVKKPVTSEKQVPSSSTPERKKKSSAR